MNHLDINQIKEIIPHRHGLVDYYRGKKLVLINRDSTPRDGRADLIIRAPIGQVFSKAMELL